MADNNSASNAPPTAQHEDQEQLQHHDQPATSNLDFLAAVSAGISQDGWPTTAQENNSADGAGEGDEGASAGADAGADADTNTGAGAIVEKEDNVLGFSSVADQQEQAQDQNQEEKKEDDDDDDDDYDPSKTVTDQFSAPFLPPPPSNPSSSSVPISFPSATAIDHHAVSAFDSRPRSSSSSSSEDDDFAQALRNKGVGGVATAPAPAPVSATVSAPIVQPDGSVQPSVASAATAATATAPAADIAGEGSSSNSNSLNMNMNMDEDTAEGNEDEYEPAAATPPAPEYIQQSEGKYAGQPSQHQDQEQGENQEQKRSQSQEQHIQSENENKSDLLNVPPQPPASVPISNSVPPSVPAPVSSQSQLSTPSLSATTAVAGDPYSPQLSSVYNPASSTAPASTAQQTQLQSQSQQQQPPSIPPSRASFREQTQSAAPTVPPTPAVPTKAKGRLPSDVIGILEDRIAADPKGDVDAWLELIEEYKNREKLDQVRDVYERFLKLFPFAAEQWVAYANFESMHNELYRLEQIFNKSLLHVPHVSLWSIYLDYIRRRHNLNTTDPAAQTQARAVITSAYDFALQKIGLDKDSAQIWTDYIQFIRSGPGIIGGSTWQDQQKMDTLRKAYHRAINVPMAAVTALWKEYDQFEMGLNKLTGRKFVQERSRGYMTARMSFVELQNITKGLVRSTVPRYPPLPGCEGYEEFMDQLELWKKWIKWEIDDPLVLKEEDADAYKSRVVYVFKQALMAMWFVPEVYFEAATFCFDNKLDSEGDEFLKQGIEANPESVLLAFKKTDRLEVTSQNEHDAKKRGAVVREAYDTVLDALYEHLAKARAKEAEEIANVEEWFANMKDISEYVPSGPHVTRKKANKNKDENGNGDDNDDDDEDDDDDDADGNRSSGNSTPNQEKSKEIAKQNEIDAVKRLHGPRMAEVSKLISYTWIALMRSMRRIQGKGKPGEMAGSRQVFAEARKRGRITSDVYIASALIEHHCYKDPAATKIFERGSKLFPEDEHFTLKYLQHLIDIHDITNARAVFEKTTRRLTENPETIGKSKVLFQFMHEYESRYGDMVQIMSIETRMRELFPKDPLLERFESRFKSRDFDPTEVKLILSPSQIRPARQSGAGAETSMSRAQSVEILDGPPTYARYGMNSPRMGGAAMGSSHMESPKRPYDYDGTTDEYGRARKYARAESPQPPRLKGAAGRRVDQNKRQMQQQQQHVSHSSMSMSMTGPSSGMGGNSSGGNNMMRGTAAPPLNKAGASGGYGLPPPPQPLPQEITYLLSIIPPAHTYEATRLNPEKMVALLRGLDMSKVDLRGMRRY